MFQPISSLFVYLFTGSQFCVPLSSLSQNFTTWNSNPEKISIILVFVYRRCCFFKLLFFLSKLITSIQQWNEGWTSIVLHRQHVKRFSCCARVCFASWKKGHLFAIMSVLVTLRFFPSSALSGDQGRFTTVSSCLYQNYNLDFLPSPYCWGYNANSNSRGPNLPCVWLEFFTG